MPNRTRAILASILVAALSSGCMTAVSAFQPPNRRAWRSVQVLGPASGARLTPLDSRAPSACGFHREPLGAHRLGFHDPRLARQTVGGDPDRARRLFRYPSRPRF